MTEVKKLEKLINSAVEKKLITLVDAKFLQQKVISGPIFSEEQKECVIQTVINYHRSRRRHLFRWLRIRLRECELGMKFQTPISVEQLKNIEERLGIFR